MNRMFYWDEERIGFFRDAAENSAYYRALADRIAPSLRKTDRVLDAGCGLGYLAGELLRYCRSVTAADCDAQAIQALRSRIGDPALHALRTDVFKMDLSAFDVIVCCRFASTREALELFRKSGARTLVMIKRNEWHHRISDSASLHERTAAEAIQTLEESNLRFTAEQVTLSFDQPFRSEKDAMRFFQLYSDRVDLTKQRDLLRETGNRAFPLCLPVVNSLTIFSVYRTKNRNPQ